MNRFIFVALLAIAGAGFSNAAAAADATTPPGIRTPPAPHTPRINGPDIFGVRPDHPFIYHIPASGDRPMKFSASHLPAGLTLDAASGNIAGTLHDPGSYRITFHAKNALGAADKKFRIVAGEKIALTPPMGWNSWNHYAGRVSRHSGRDIIFSLSNNMNITNAPAISKIANSWRTTGDIKANWISMTQRGFGQDKWESYAGPGHWNDPDMLEIGTPL